MVSVHKWRVQQRELAGQLRVTDNNNTQVSRVWQGQGRERALKSVAAAACAAHHVLID